MGIRMRRFNEARALGPGKTLLVEPERLRTPPGFNEARALGPGKTSPPERVDWDHPELQ